MIYKLMFDGKPNKNNQYPVWFIPDHDAIGFRSIPIGHYKQASIRFQEWVYSLPLTGGYDRYNWDDQTNNIIYVNDRRDLALLKLCFDPVMFG